MVYAAQGVHSRWCGGKTGFEFPKTRIFENSVPGLPEAAAAQGLTPLAYMRKYGAFAVKRDVYNLHNTPVDPAYRLTDTPAS